MNLICPHCQKRVSVSDAYAGQTTTCTFCGGPFTVPMPPGESGASAYGTFGGASYARSGSSAVATESVAPPTNSQSEPDLPPLPGSSYVTTGEYRRHVPLELNATVVRWIAPVCIILIFFPLLFMPWVGVYAGNETVARQLGIGVAFGWVRTHANNFVPALETVSGTALALYFFLMFIGFLLSIGFIFVVTASPSLRASIPPWAYKLMPWRPMVLGGLAILAFLFLMPYLVISLPFEAKVTENADKTYEAVKKAGEELKVSRTELLTTQPLQRRGWFTLTVLLNLLAIAAAVADFWLERRALKQLPRVLFEW
jgi:hypothetical protein